MNTMKTKKKSLIPSGLQAELRAVIADLATGKRDAKAMDKAARDMDRMREETRKKLGTLDVAVDLIREGRDDP
jgi:hypothetical protein